MTLALLIGILPVQKAEAVAFKQNSEQKMPPMQKCMDEMKLTEAQMEKFAAAKAQFQKKDNTLGAEIDNLRLDMIEAMKTENLKRAKELNKQITDRILLLKNARIDMMADVLKELTPEQKEIWKKNAGMMMGNMGMKGMGECMQMRQGMRWHGGRGGRGFQQDDANQDCKPRMHRRNNR